MVSKNKKKKTFIVIAAGVILVVGGTVLYAQKHKTCDPSASDYSTCNGGCYNNDYYEKHIDQCNNI